MIKSSQPLTLAEVKEIVKESGTDVKEMEHYLKTFCVLDLKEAKEMKKELTDLNFMALKEEYIIKIVDFLPEDKEDLLKILVDVTVSEDETNKILDVVKKYR